MRSVRSREEKELERWIWLTQRPGIGARGCALLLKLFGSAACIHRLTEQELRQTPGFETRWLAPLLDKDLRAAEAVLRRCDDLGIHVLTWGSARYPERLRNIPDPPVVLYYKGTLPDFDREAAIAVVGSRRCSAYGLMNARRFGRQISACGGLVISGGARGIDTMATRGALEANAPMVTVLGCGVDVCYPRQNCQLFEDVLLRGCLLSEYPPGTPPNGHNFPVRNRIISGLSLGVLVIEAPENSGALITANLALEQGRDVFAIPGNLGLRQCEGSNRLLREGALLVESGWDILRDYTYLYPDRLSDCRTRESLEQSVREALRPTGEEPTDRVASAPPVEAIPAAQASTAPPLPTLSVDEQTVLALLSAEPVHGDTLVARSALPAQRVLAALTMLQIKQLAQKLAGNLYQRKF